jgi:hypothetical protein
MQNIIHRAATEADLPACIDLFLAAVADMYARQHITQPLPPRAAVEMTRSDLVCGGVGGPLLRDMWQAGARMGAEIFFVWSSPDETALASYLKIGMLPGYPVFTFTMRDASTHDFASNSTGDFAHNSYEVEPLRLDIACDVDEEVRATRRETDHRFLLALPRGTARQVIRAGRAVGYFYVNNDAVGPCAWLAPEHAEGVLAHARRAALESAGAITVRVPGINQDAIRFAFAHRLRLVGAHAQLLTTAPFGRLAQYIPSGPSLY